MIDIIGTLNTFYSSTVIISLSSFLLWIAWQRLHAAINTLPLDGQRVIFNVKGIIDKQIKGKAELMTVLYVACIFFGVAIISSAFVIFAASSKFINPSYPTDNYQTVPVLYAVSNLFLFSGIYALSLTLLVEFLRITSGKGSALLFVPKDTNKVIEYQAVFSTSIGLRAELTVEQQHREKWWRKLIFWKNWTLEIWAFVLGLVFIAIDAIVGIIQIFNKDFPSLPKFVVALIIAIIALSVIIWKQRRSTTPDP